MTRAGPRLLTRADALPFLRALPLHDPALGLPPATVAALADLGLRDAGDLADLPRDALALRFDAPVLAARERATLLDDPPLRPWTAPAVLAVDRRPDGGLADRTLLERLLDDLAAHLAARLAARGRAAGTLALTLSCADASVLARRSRHTPPLRDASRVAAAARALLARGDPRAAVEEVTLAASDLRPVRAAQGRLWDDGPGGRGADRLADALQALARRHGRPVLRRPRPDPFSPDGWAWDAVDAADAVP